MHDLALCEQPFLFLLFLCLSQWCVTFGGSRRYFICYKWLRSPCWTVFWPRLPKRSPCAHLCATTATWSSPTPAWIVKSQRVSTCMSQCTILSAVTFTFMVFIWVHLCVSFISLKVGLLAVGSNGLSWAVPRSVNRGCQWAAHPTECSIWGGKA